MSVGTHKGLHTYDDFCFLVKDGQKGDLIDGVIYMASPESVDANLLFMWLGAVMTAYVRKKNLGTVVGSRVALRLDDRNGPEPDIAYVRRERSEIIQPAHILGPADLVIEIVSPDSVERDYQKKRRQYQRAAVPEYWILDPLDKRVTQLCLGPSGRYRRMKLRKGELHSQVLPGFWLRIEWLWQDEFPDLEEVLKVIRAESK
jgi:Uma2 family endonuclease